MDEKLELVEALIRKYFPEDDEETDTGGNRKIRMTQLERNKNWDEEISFQEVQVTIQSRP